MSFDAKQMTSPYLSESPCIRGVSHCYTFLLLSVRAITLSAHLAMLASSENCVCTSSLQWLLHKGYFSRVGGRERGGGKSALGKNVNKPRGLNFML